MHNDDLSSPCTIFILSPQLVDSAKSLLQARASLKNSLNRSTYGAFIMLK